MERERLMQSVDKEHGMSLTHAGAALHLMYFLRTCRVNTLEKKMESERVDFDRQLAELRTEAAEHCKNAEENKKAIRELQDDFAKRSAAYEGRIATLNQQVKGAETRNVELEERLRIQQNEADAHRAQLECSEQKISELQRHIDQLDEERNNDLLELSQERVRKENESLKCEIDRYVKFIANTPALTNQAAAWSLAKDERARQCPALPSPSLSVRLQALRRPQSRQSPSPTLLGTPWTPRLPRCG